MKLFYKFILLLLFFIIVSDVTVNAQRRRGKAKKVVVKKKAKKISTRRGSNTAKINKTNNNVSSNVNSSNQSKSNNDTVPEKVVTILSAFKPQLKNLAKIDFATASERNDTGSIKVEYQVPSQNLSFQYQPIALVPRSFKYDSFNTSAANTNVKVGYGNFLHYLIDLNYNVTGKNNNTHSFNINTASIEGTHHLQKYKDWGVGYIGDYVFSNQGHLLTNLYFKESNRFRFGLVPDTIIYPSANYKQNSYLTGISFSWLNAHHSNRNLHMSPTLVYEYFEGIKGRNNHWLQLTSPLLIDINNGIKVNLDVSYSISSYNILNSENQTNSLLKFDPAIRFNKLNSLFKIGFSPVLMNKDFKLFPNVEFKRSLKDTNVTFVLGWRANVNNTQYANLVAQNPWIDAPEKLAMTTKDSKYLEVNMTNGKRLSYGFSFSLDDYENLPLFNKIMSNNRNTSGLLYQTAFEKKASTIQFDANLRYQFSDVLLVANKFKYIQFNSIQVNAKPWGILPIELNSQISWVPSKKLLLSGGVQYWSGATLYNESSLPYDLNNALNINAELHYKLTSKWNIWIKGDNLLDKPYERWADYPSLGVQFIAGIVYSFK